MRRGILKYERYLKLLKERGMRLKKWFRGGSKLKSRLLYIFISVALLIVWSYGYYYGQYAKSHFNAVSVRMREAAVTWHDIQIALENEEIKGKSDIPVITVWEKSDEKRFECQELATTANLPVIEFLGDVTQVMPFKLVSGSIITPADESGCLIEENAAYRLFRTKYAVGRRIDYESKSYIIRGIIKAKEELVIIPVIDEKNAYSNLEFVFGNKESGKQNVEAFMKENGFSDDYTVVEGCFYAGLIQIIPGLPLWILCFYLLYKLMKEGKEISGYLVKEIKLKLKIKEIKKSVKRTLNINKLLESVGVFAAFIITVILFIRLTTEFVMPVPERYIPTRWSDFAFWTKQFKEAGKQILALEYLPPVTKDILLFQAIRRCITSGIITSVLTLVMIIQRRNALYII